MSPDAGGDNHRWREGAREGEPERGAGRRGGRGREERPRPRARSILEENRGIVDYEAM